MSTLHSILLLDELDGALRGVASALTTDRFEVNAVRSVDAARTRLAEESFDAVVSQPTLPDGDWYDALVAARASATPFVLWVGGGVDEPADEIVTAAFAADVADVVTGGSCAELRSRLSAICEGGAAGGSAEAEAGAEVSTARFHALAESATDAIVVVDTDGSVHYANDAVETVFGYSSAELVGRPLTDLIPDPLTEQHEAGFARYLRTGERTLDWNGIQLPGRCRDGSEVPIAVSFAEFTHRGERYFAGIVRDITARRRHEERLARQNHRLSEFTAIVSHDLRNPLKVASGFLELAREERDDANLTRAAEALDRMEQLVDELLVLARQGELVDDVEPVSLDRVVEAAWSSVESDDGTLRRIDELGTVDADEERLRQLFENLFGNAIVHAGPDPTLTVGRLPDGFFVADDGHGIPPERRADAFEPGHTTHEQGTGFGLAIVERIAEAHDWTVAVTDSEAGGARFEIRV